MAKRTKRIPSPEEVEWEAGREWRERFVLRRLNALQHEMEEREQTEPATTFRRRLFPWRLRLERLH